MTPLERRRAHLTWFISRKKSKTGDWNLGKITEEEIQLIWKQAEAWVTPRLFTRPNRVANPYQHDPVRAVIWSRAFRGCYAHQNGINEQEESNG